MNTAIFSIEFVLALSAAITMGFAIQRGATCTVAAVDEIVSNRTGNKLWAMLEAALWVAVGLGLALHWHWLAGLPRGYALTQWTFLGAVLLGFGSWLNNACVFGAIARLGSGEWAYVGTPIGYYLGCLSVKTLFGVPASVAQPSDMFMQVAANAALWPLAALMALRLYALFGSKGQAKAGFAAGYANTFVWSPHCATIVIGFMFLVTSILVGTWAYTDILAQLVNGMRTVLPVGAFMAVALLAGAILGGYKAGRLRWHPVSVAAIARCLLGGMVMAWGSLLIPGGNDGLILIGMPLLWPYAWAAFLTMCLTVALALSAQARVARWGAD